ncbi:MAG: ABC transporter substrate-binding protein [Moraxellaceae bacterium]|nr:ABC transporter substrate-binding protein [Moraxellaceae bacterium]
MKFLKACVSLLAAVSFPVFANDIAPDAMIKQVSDEVLQIVRSDKAIQAGDMKRISEVVDAKMLPHVNFTRMTSLAVGRDWRSATPQQQADLGAEFKTLLVRSYAGALSNYRDQQIVFKAFKMKPEETDVLVRTDVRQPGAQPVAIDYNVMKTPDGWKIYDVAVAGVSLVTNYREEFGREIRANGIDGLIKSLRDKNRSAEQAKK